MALRSYDAVAEKILADIYTAVKKDSSIDTFEVIPTLEIENKNSSPVLKGGQSLGLESWSIPHIYPYAHHQVMDRSNYKGEKLEKVLPCLLGAALLNPEMPAVWSIRRELILAQKLPINNELRVTKMALSRKPKCNEGLIHRRWVLSLISKTAEDSERLLRDELQFASLVADKYYSNYHAWNHRLWCLQHLPYNKGRSTQAKLLLDHSLTSAQLSALLTSREFCLYTTELDASITWVSSHVSDHSGLHFRGFLVTQMLDVITTRHDSTQAQDENRMTAFAENVRSQIKQFLDTCKSHVEPVALRYLTVLETRLTVFDVVISLLVQESRWNLSLSTIFQGHEALWYYRRFVIFKLFEVIESLLPTHDRNGLSEAVQRMFKVHVMEGERRHLACVTEDGAATVTSKYQLWLTKALHLDDKYL